MVAPSGVIGRFKGAVDELRSLLLEPDFVIDEGPIEIKEGLQHLSTVKMKAIMEEEAADDVDLITIFTRIVQREVEAIERAQRAEQLGEDSQAVEKLMKQMLPVLDSFDRVLEVARAATPSEETTNWLKSVESVYFRSLKTLERFGLAPLKSIGRVVNLDIHEVVEYRPTLDHPGDTVISERQKGYLYNGRLLREAQVVVAQSLRS